MTTDPTPDRNDPLRALDAVEPADRWDDVVSRSTEGELLELAPASARRSFPRPLLAAAAVLAVVAMAAGVFALTRGDDDTQNLAIQSAVGVVGEDGYIWNSTWELVAVERPLAGPVWLAEPNGEAVPQLTIGDPNTGAISYQACNQGSGKATLEGDQLVVTDFGITEMYCSDNDDPDDDLDSRLMDQEAFVTDLLIARPTVEITGPVVGVAPNSAVVFGPPGGIGDKLRLVGGEGSVTFERTEMSGPTDGDPIDSKDPTAIWGRMWEVTGLTSEGKTKFVAIPFDGSPLTMDARTTDRLSFITGCNGAGGQFDLVEDRLVVVEIGPSTAMDCENALMDQDHWLQNFLEAEPTVTIVGDHLTLATDQATIELQASDVVVGHPIGPEDPDGTVSNPPQPRVGPDDPDTSGSTPAQGPVDSDTPNVSPPVGDAAGIWSHTWTVVKITERGQERQLIAPADGNPLRLEATTDDATKATGYASFNGCNGTGGRFDLFGARLVIAEQMSGRQKLCEPDALMAQEEWLWSFLTSGPTVTIDGDNLTLAADQATIDLVAD